MPWLHFLLPFFSKDIIIYQSSFCLQPGEEHSREVMDLLTKALKHCDVKTPGARQPLYQYRAAVIYMRLAGIYHNAVR